MVVDLGGVQACKFVCSAIAYLWICWLCQYSYCGQVPNCRSRGPRFCNMGNFVCLTLSVSFGRVAVRQAVGVVYLVSTDGCVVYNGYWNSENQGRQSSSHSHDWWTNHKIFHSVH